MTEDNKIERAAKMFNKILIANRGEIACRVIRTARKLGIRTVAVYSTADQNAQHVQMADEAYFIGDSPVTDSYLKSQLIIDVAKRSGAEAVHPGYGFLSENATFAKSCEAEGIVFIGPPATAIEAMGSKSAAKEIMARANVPMVPGYYGDDQSPTLLLSEAQKIGFPVLIKACAGGGGKGMRIVDSESEFESALLSCQRESMTAFADEKVLIEKYLTSPRHIEIQIFLDQHQNAVHLYERDCSVQRRYQKVIEEAPAPNFSDELRTQMGQVAIQAAKAINYVGAGTVEFLFEDDQFYFMEMNTRLQVEHPITEMVTGVDLVEWQLVVAAGNTLPKQQPELTLNGHAFEVRLYAEDPQQNFLPSTGKIQYLTTPALSPHVRIDSGVRQGDEVSVFYDPMLAKLIVWDSDRSRALNRLHGALADYQVIGVKTNLTYTKAIATHPAFERGIYSTAFINTYGESLFQTDKTNDIDYVLAAVFVVEQAIKHSKTTANTARELNSPWRLNTGWQNNLTTSNQFKFINANSDEPNEHISVTVAYSSDNLVVSIGENDFVVEASLSGNTLNATLVDQQISVNVISDQQTIHLLSHGRQIQIQQYVEQISDGHASANANITAPMHGSIVAIHVNEGDEVSVGEKLITMEAMKMEHVITASSAGKIELLNTAVGEMVHDGFELVVIADHE